MGEKIDTILEEYYHKRIDLLEVRKKLLELTSKEFDEGYKRGYNDAASEARQEIAKNYHINN